MEFGMFYVDWYHLVMIVFAALIGGVIGYGLGANRNISGQHPSYKSESTEEEQEEEEMGEIHILFNDGKKVDITCEYLDDYDFSDGALTLNWDSSGVVTVIGNQTEEYDTDDESLTLAYSNVKDVKFLGL